MHPGNLSNPWNDFRPLRYTIDEVREMKEKEEEKKPIPWILEDPKPPVIQSGHMENRRQFSGKTE